MAKGKIGVHGSDSETGRARGDKEKKVKVPDISKEEFEKEAKAVNLGEVLQNRFADAKTFKKGSYGFFLNDKVTIMVNGKPVKCQANILFTVVNSKPDEEASDSE